MVERVHKTINNGRCRCISCPDELHDKFDGYLSAVTKAINSTVHTTLNATPTQLVFRRDAFLPVAFEADYIAEKTAPYRAKQQTRERQAAPHTYSVNDQVMIRHEPNQTWRDTYKGPYLHRSK
jgi:hypothetical protein